MTPATRTTPQTDWRNVAHEIYFAAVDRWLEVRFGVTVAERLAWTVVRAAREAGYSPLECAEWLAQVDRL